MSENDFWIEIFKIKALSFEKLTEKSIQIEPFIPRKESVRLTFKNSKKFRLDSEFSFCLYSFDFPFKRNSGYLKEITREHNPILISTNELKRLNLKDGHLVRVKFLDDITGLEVGHLVAQLMGTESIADKVLAIDRGLGGFSLSRQIDILNQKDTIYLDKAEATFSIDGDKIEFRYNSKDGGLWQNPLYPTSSKFHKVVIEEAIKGDRIGDLLINHQNSLKVAKAHKDF
jgi:hypothetical protein